MRFNQRSRLAVLLWILACGGPTSVTEDDFTITTTGQEVVLRNGAGKPTFYLVVERETAAVINFGTCVDESRCPLVAPGATVRVPYSEITGYRPGRKEAIIYSWRSGQSPTGPYADSIQSTVIEL